MKSTSASARAFQFALFFPAIALLVSCKDSAPASGDAATGLASSQPAVSAGMNAVAIPAASIEAMVNPSHLPIYTGATGSVEGTISVIGDPSPDATGVDFTKCPAAADVYGKVFREGARFDDGSRALPDALVIVSDYAGFIPERAPAKRLTIKDCAYDTRTIDLTFGQKLEVVNHDAKGFYAPVLSNNPMPAVMIPPPNGDPITLYPKAGHATLSDQMGGPLTADVWALLQPLHTVSDMIGHYRIDGIPVGNAQIGVHLRAIQNDVKKPIEIHEGVVLHVDLVLENKAHAATTKVNDAGARKPNLR